MLGGAVAPAVPLVCTGPVRYRGLAALQTDIANLRAAFAHVPHVAGGAVDDVLSALVNLGYQRPAAEKAIEQAVEKDKALAGDFDGLFRGALKVIR